MRWNREQQINLWQRARWSEADCQPRAGDRADLLEEENGAEYPEYRFSSLSLFASIFQWWWKNKYWWWSIADIGHQLPDGEGDSGLAGLFEAHQVRDWRLYPVHYWLPSSRSYWPIPPHQSLFQGGQPVDPKSRRGGRYRIANRSICPHQAHEGPVPLISSASSMPATLQSQHLRLWVKDGLGYNPVPASMQDAERLEA